MVCEFP